MTRPVIVDTNILFSALLRKNSYFTRVILKGNHHFYVSELAIGELFKHKNKMLRLSKLCEEEIVQLLYELVRAVNFCKEDLVHPANRRQAHHLCHEVDPADAPHVAITLELNGLLWTGDKALKQELTSKGFSDFFDPYQTQTIF